MALRTANDLIVRELKEIYSAERQLARVIPKLAKSVSSPKLRDMLDQRRQHASELLEGLDEVFDEMGAAKGRQKNAAVEGLIDDVSQHVDDIDEDRLLDVALLGGVQKIEHYCIAAWGTAKSLGQATQMQKIVDCMQKALDQGRQFDQEMTQLAESEVNPAILDGGEKGEEAEAGEEGSPPKGQRGRRKSAS